MDVALVYRRQAIVREICRRVGYQGRFVWLISAPDVTIRASHFTGQSRLRFVMVNITRMPYKFVRFSAREAKRVKLDYDTVICALPTLRGRRRDLLVFMLCRRVRETQWSLADSNKIAPEEMAVCLGQESFDPATMAVAHAVCVYRDLVDPRGRLTARGFNLVDGKKQR
jgi:hypothetical protein